VADFAPRHLNRSTFSRSRKSNSIFGFKTNSETCMEKQTMLEIVLKRFETPDETRVFDKGKFEIVNIGGMTIGRASYEPGWKWSEDVGSLVGTPLCEVEHVGMVVSGRAMAAMADGTEVELSPGSLFYIPPIAHDSWVIGNEPYVSLHFLGADHYTK
jgi:hypothetical protein